MSHMYTLLECKSVLEDEESTFKPFSAHANHFATND